MLSYVEPVYRPPSEGRSLIFQVTVGCSFNKCSFCDMYRNKQYVERGWDEIKTEIDYAAGEFPSIGKIFLADGDALNLPTERMLQIVEYLYKSFPDLERVSCYAMPKNLLQKSRDELGKLRNAGLNMVYLGIETGSDRLLKKVTKGATAKGIIEACSKAKDAGMIVSCMVILGLGGKTYTEEHAIETAKVASAISPDYLAALTLYLETGVKEEFLTKFGEPFIQLNDQEVLDELKLLVERLEPRSPVVFRVNHASNPYPIKGTLPDGKAGILQTIAHLMSHPELYRPSEMRGF